MNQQRDPHDPSPPWSLGLKFDGTQSSIFSDQSVKEFLLQDFTSENAAIQGSKGSITSPDLSTQQAPGDYNQDQDVSLDNRFESNGPVSHSSSTLLAPSLQSENKPGLGHDPSDLGSSPVAVSIGPDDTISGHSINHFDQNRSRIPSSIWQIWWMEGLSTAIALCCFISIILLLSVFENEPLAYQPKIISINSMISIFSSIFKASLIMPVAEGIAQLTWDWFSQPRKLSDVSLFDGASRGPWGSFTFLIKAVTRINEVYLPSLGALITIAALAIDPFTQALVEHVVCRRAMEAGIAQVARTNNYSTTPPSRGGTEFFNQAGLESSMHVAIYRGLIESVNESSLLDVTCQKGNCTFGSEDGGGFFSSLAMCHSCSDISNTIIKGSKDEYAYSLPSKLKVNSKTALASQSKSTTYGEDNFFKFEALMLNFPSDSDRVSGAFAVKCTLNPCVKTYSAVVESNIYLEYEKNKQPAPTLQIDGQPGTSDFSLVTNSSFVDGKKMDCKSSTNPRDIHTVAVGVDPESHHFVRPLGYAGRKWIYYPRECVWFVDASSAISIQVTLEDLLTGKVEMQANVITSQNIDGDIWFRNLFADGQGDLKTANTLFSGLASSITAAMRNRPFYNKGGPLAESHGTAYDVTTCINVRWPWISYPAALLALQILFCAFILWSRRKAKLGDDRVRGDWKSSPLVLLFHGMDEDLRWALGGVSSVKGMEDVAKEANVQLRELDIAGQPRWRFCAS